LYLESPGGVGFSKANKDYLNSSDTSVAQDNYQALLRFFDKFPNLRDNDLYLTGESYAGVYIPRLADVIISNNQQ
jgi:carboxypeptidase C (cathepsin A)